MNFGIKYEIIKKMVMYTFLVKIIEKKFIKK